MYQLMTIEDFNAKYNVGLNENITTQAPAAMQAAAPADKKFCPVRHAQEIGQRHKVVSLLHTIIMILLVILLFRLAFKA